LISDEVIALALTYLLVELLVIWAYFRAVCLDTAACFIGPSFVVGVTALWNALALAQVKVEELSLWTRHLVARSAAAAIFIKVLSGRARVVINCNSALALAALWVPVKSILTELILAQTVAKFAVPIQVVWMAIPWLAFEIADDGVTVEDKVTVFWFDPFTLTKAGSSVPKLRVTVLMWFTYLRLAFTLFCLVIVIIISIAFDRNQLAGTGTHVPVLGTEVTEAIFVFNHNVWAILLNTFASTSLVVPWQVGAA
jgi:hypothetical protein